MRGYKHHIVLVSAQYFILDQKQGERREKQILLNSQKFEAILHFPPWITQPVLFVARLLPYCWLPDPGRTQNPAGTAITI
jgi:hypothetical protein